MIVDLNLRDATHADAKGQEQRLRFSAKEFSIIEMLALNKGRVLSKQHIYESLYDYSADDAPTPSNGKLLWRPRVFSRKLDSFHDRLGVSFCQMI